MNSKPSTTAPQATARLVVTMPPEPSRLSKELSRDIASQYVSLTPTRHAFIHLARRAVDRFTIMVPSWIVRERNGHANSSALLRPLNAPGSARGSEPKRDQNKPSRASSRIRNNFGLLRVPSLDDETFHAKIVLADGVAAYVGSANMLRRSMDVNFECGFLVEGPAVEGVRMLVEAVLRLSDDP